MCLILESGCYNLNLSSSIYGYIVQLVAAVSVPSGSLLNKNTESQASPRPTESELHLSPDDTFIC